MKSEQPKPTSNSMRNSSTHPNINSHRSNAINELTNLIADSNILIPVNTTKTRHVVIDETPQTPTYTRSRSSGPIASSSNSKNNTAPKTSAVVLEKKSLDKFLKLASNSASLLDLNQQTQATSHQLKTSSSNLLALCGAGDPTPASLNNSVYNEDMNENEHTYNETLKSNMQRKPQTLKFDGQTPVINGNVGSNAQSKQAWVMPNRII